MATRKIEMDARRVYDLSVALLARRAHSRVELEKKLLAKGGLPEAVEAALARLDELGYLDDAVFARDLVRSRMTHKRWGPAKVKMELRAKGIADEIVEAALREAMEGVEPEEAARAALIARFGPDRPAEQKELKRRYDYLMRRGFGHDAVRQALEGLNQ